MLIETSPDDRNSHLESALVHATFVRQKPAKTRKKPSRLFSVQKTAIEIPAKAAYNENL
jgi:hypothetical protein